MAHIWSHGYWPPAPRSPEPTSPLCSPPSPFHSPPNNRTPLETLEYFGHFSWCQGSILLCRGRQRNTAETHVQAHTCGATWFPPRSNNAVTIWMPTIYWGFPRVCPGPGLYTYSSLWIFTHKKRTDIHILKVPDIKASRSSETCPGTRGNK